jgi:3-mercaptopyruvate sulfurtransferase SseA
LSKQKGENFMTKSFITVSLTTAALLLSSCGSSSSNDTNQTTDETITALSPAQIASRSANSYSDNSYGVVSATKVAKWISDWKNNKPEGISGKLLIMQVGDIYGDEYDFIKSNGVDVFVFDRTDGCTDTGVSRHDGVSNIPKPVFTGEEMKQAFNAYNIDPQNDMILIVLAEGSGSYMAGAARMWYTMRYWGVEAKNVSLLNGQASNVLNPDVNADIAALGLSKADLFAKDQSTPPMNGTHTAKELSNDGTALQATMKDMMDLVTTGDDYIILDARSEAEYSGDVANKQSKTEFKVCGANKDEQCYTAFEGHIKGAQNLYYTDVLHTDDASKDINDDNLTDSKDATYSFKSIADIQALFSSAGYTSGKTVYTYCRTGTKASLLTFTSSAVLGYPTRLYDGSWIQWGKMANATDVEGTEILPSDSIWRVDVAQYSEAIAYNPNATQVSPNRDLNLSNTNTDAIITADQNYKK